MGWEWITGPNFIVPTPAAGDSTNKVADTAFVATAIANQTAIVTSILVNYPLSETASTGTVTLSASLTATSASLGADVNLNNTASYFDGPSVAQGSSGTWFASGSVTCLAPATTTIYDAKLWDGSTVIDSAEFTQSSTGAAVSVSLSGFIASPAGNLRISVKDTLRTTGAIKFNQTGNSKDSTITAVRLA